MDNNRKQKIGTFTAKVSMVIGYIIVVSLVIIFFDKPIIDENIQSTRLNGTFIIIIDVILSLIGLLFGIIALIMKTENKKAAKRGLILSGLFLLMFFFA